MGSINCIGRPSFINHCSWSPHISDIVTKVSRTLNFIKRNLSKCSSQLQVKESAYLTMFRPQLEYASDVWDPHYVGDTM